MSYASQMLDTHPRELAMDKHLLARCIEACHDCATACTACADACLGEQDVTSLNKCIRTDLDCADICEATGRIVSRQTEQDASTLRAIVSACVQACHACAEECERHGQQGMEHCRVCAEACRSCEQACVDLLSALN